MTEREREDIFNEWIKQYKALLFKVIRAYAFNQEDQDDLFQEISIQVWQSIPAFKKQSKTSTWLYKVSLNTAIKWVKKSSKHKQQYAPLNEELILTEKAEKSDERLDWIYEEITKMDKIDRSLTLLLLDGFSYKEMADILGIKSSHVGVKVHRIKNQLIQESEKYVYDGI